MTYSTNPKKLQHALEIAGDVPAGHTIEALYRPDGNERSAEPYALVMRPDSTYYLMSDGVVSPVDQRAACRALDAAEAGGKSKSYSKAEIRRRTRRINKHRKARQQ